MNDDYAIGVYGCRNVCSQLANRGLTSSSFVSGMSWGYSGNLGYPLPANWAFDQIANYDIGSGAGLLEIDNDIVSGSDLGVDSVSRPSSTSGKANLSDIGGWGGDLISVLGSLMVAGLPIDQAYDFAKDSIATLTNSTYFSMGDMLADVDALIFGQECKQDSTALLSSLFQSYYSDRTASIGRFALFLVNRFGTGRADRIAAASAIFYDDSDAETVAARNALWTKDFSNSGIHLIGDVPNTYKDAVTQAFVDVVTDLADR
jgi:peptidoglycan hydrolase-like protein with peptidoglycan-binding domain